MKFEQRMKVATDEWDGDSFGNEWQVHYVLFETEDYNGYPCFDLHTDDGNGSGEMVCRFYNIGQARHLTLKLGTLVEYEPGRKPIAA